MSGAHELGRHPHPARSDGEMQTKTPTGHFILESLACPLSASKGAPTSERKLRACTWVCELAQPLEEQGGMVSESWSHCALHAHAALGHPLQTVALGPLASLRSY